MRGDKLLSLRKLALLGAIEGPIKLSSGHLAEAIKSSTQTAARKKLKGRKGIVIRGFESEKRAFGGGMCFPCKILDDGAEGIKSSVIIPDHTHYPEDVLEIISPVYLGYELQLEDGDEIRVMVMT